MRGPEFDDSDEGLNVLVHEHGIDRDLLDELFSEAEDKTQELEDEAGLADGLDIDIVQGYVKIAFCEYLSWADEEGDRDVGFYCRRTMTEMTVDTCRNTQMLIDRVADRHPEVTLLHDSITDGRE
ncbi:hypothetical protein [Halorubellus salinus]|uniref:hypothetical protein n=1 Tax=Halorubellus salinus TaxID=755309 RepID=UPI001D0807FE|nr:hypothetical protein [Halorubellus salinus]